MVVLMETKELEQFRCDYFAVGEEVVVEAKWLQSKLMEIDSMKKIIKSLSNQNELLQSLPLVREFDSPKYRINIKG